MKDQSDKLPSAAAVHTHQHTTTACPTCSVHDDPLLTAHACPPRCRYRPFIEQQLCSLFPGDDSPQVVWLPATAMLQEEGIPADLEAAAEDPVDSQVTKPAWAMPYTSSLAPLHTLCATTGVCRLCHALALSCEGTAGSCSQAEGQRCQKGWRLG